LQVRHQFTDGDLVCSIIDWRMAPLPGILTAAELPHINNGTIVRGELIYDAEDLRKAIAPGRPTPARRISSACSNAATTTPPPCWPPSPRPVSQHPALRRMDARPDSSTPTTSGSGSPTGPASST
jgi:hypothetical protein